MTYKDAIIEIDSLCKDYDNKHYHGIDRLGIISFTREKLNSVIIDLERILKTTEYNIKVEERLKKIPNEIKHFEKINDEFDNLLKAYISTKNKKNKKGETSLNQIENSLLMNYFIQYNISMKGLDSKIIANSFSELTGYGIEKLRKSINKKESKLSDDIVPTKVNYDNLKGVLLRIINQIDKDKVSITKSKSK